MGYIKDKIKEYYSIKPTKTYEHGLISPSMLGGCPRVMYYKIKGIPETTPPDTNALMNFEVGNMWEANISNYLENLKILIHWWIDGQQVRLINENEWTPGVLRKDKWIDEELGVAGTLDQIYLQDNKTVLLDTKTQSEGKAKYVAKLTDEEYWNTDGYGYRLQLGCYMLMAKRRFEKGLEKFKVDYGKLVLISKDNGFIFKEPCLFYDEKLERDVIERINYLRSFINNNEIPPCECNIVDHVHNKGMWKVSFCRYGVVDSIQPNSKKRNVPTKCCQLLE